MKFSLFTLIFAGFLIVSCASKAPIQFDEEFNPEKSFSKANELIDDKKYDDARTLLLEIKNRDFSGKFAPLAQLRIADSYQKEGENERAAEEFRKFLELYPDHRHAAYAQYQIAMVYFNEIESPERGYGGALRSLQEFEKLKRDYPRNPYKEVIEIRIEKCRNTMAEYELRVGEFYEKKGSYEAAIGRYEDLLAKFPDYKGMAAVYFHLGTSYRKIGQINKAEEAFNLLIDKYPDDPLVAKAKKELASLKTGSK